MQKIILNKKNIPATPTFAFAGEALLTLASIAEELLSGGDTTFAEAAALDFVDELDDLVVTDEDPEQQKK